MKNFLKRFIFFGFFAAMQLNGSQTEDIEMHSGPLPRVASGGSKRKSGTKKLANSGSQKLKPVRRTVLVASPDATEFKAAGYNYIKDVAERRAILMGKFKALQDQALRLHELEVARAEHYAGIWKWVLIQFPLVHYAFFGNTWNKLDPNWRLNFANQKMLLEQELEKINDASELVVIKDEMQDINGRVSVLQEKVEGLYANRGQSEGTDDYSGSSMRPASLTLAQDMQQVHEVVQEVDGKVEALSSSVDSVNRGVNVLVRMSLGSTPGPTSFEFGSSVDHDGSFNLEFSATPPVSPAYTKSLV